MQSNKFSEPSENNEARQLINNWLGDKTKNEQITTNNEIQSQQQMTLAQNNSLMPHQNV